MLQNVLDVGACRGVRRERVRYGAGVDFVVGHLWPVESSVADRLAWLRSRYEYLLGVGRLRLEIFISYEIENLGRGRLAMIMVANTNRIPDSLSRPHLNVVLKAHLFMDMETAPHYSLGSLQPQIADDGGDSPHWWGGRPHASLPPQRSCYS
jgi:hypothetical protein